MRRYLIPADKQPDNGINWDYVDKACGITSNNVFFWENMAGTSDVNGIVLAQYKRSKAQPERSLVYIDVVVAKTGYGAEIVWRVIHVKNPGVRDLKIAAKEKEIVFTLHALPKAVEFYAKLGFQNTGDDKEGLIGMIFVGKV